MTGKRDNSKLSPTTEPLIPCSPDEIRLEDGTVRIMTETEQLQRRIDVSTGEVWWTKTFSEVSLFSTVMSFGFYRNVLIRYHLDLL